MVKLEVVVLIIIVKNILIPLLVQVQINMESGKKQQNQIGNMLLHYMKNQ